MKLKNVKRKVAMLLTLAMASTSVITSAFATPGYTDTKIPGVVDMEMGGPAEIVVHGVTNGTVGKEEIKGKEFQLYQLFTAENAAGGESINYKWNENYKGSIQKVVSKRLSKATGKTVHPSTVTEYVAVDYIQSLNTNKVEGAYADQKEETREGNGYRLFVEELRDQLKKDGIEPPIIRVNAFEGKSNSFRITNIPSGYYILDEITKPSSPNANPHSAASLCITTTANNRAEVHLKSDYPEVTKFIQENKDGWKEEEGNDFEIGQTVQYKLESTIPDIRGYHKYVYKFHDLMDEALTLNKDSVKIVVDGEVSGSPKSYTLRADEFHLDEINTDEETFCIAIDDIKAILDREFANQDLKKPEGENRYGQAVTVTYTAQVNDKASAKPGNPGLNNTIKLEYSFNPDGDGVEETTTTPTSTVKSYTYKLDLTKLNDHQKTLSGAQFKLYSDAELKNQVLVKKMDDGYHVINRDTVGGTDKTGGTTTGETMVSDSKGKVIINGLDSDEYWLVETQSPDGYRRILDPIHIDIKAVIEGKDELNEIKSLTATYDMKTFYNGAFIDKAGETLETDVATGTINMTIVNAVGSKLPVTGTTAGLILFVVGIGVIGTATVLNKKKKA